MSLFESIHIIDRQILRLVCCSKKEIEEREIENTLDQMEMEREGE